MEILEIIIVLVFVCSVVAFGVFQSQKGAKKTTAKSYFLAGGDLSWWLIGFSLIAANISTEQFVGMSGGAAGPQGLAIASWEWLAAVALVIVAFVFLPKFLSRGIYTIPEFLEQSYGKSTRVVVAVFTILVIVLVPTASVIFSGAKFITEYYSEVSFLINLNVVCFIIAFIATLYVYIGGLKACAWTDMIWGISLIIGGAIVTWLAFSKLGSLSPEELVKNEC